MYCNVEPKTCVCVAPFELHLQMQGVKKAKQFELRKLIRRLKAAAAASIAGNAAC